MGTYHTILVPLDGSEFGERAIPIAVQLAQRNGARLEVALVHQPLQGFATAMEMPQVGAEYEAEARFRERAYLDQTAQRLGSQHNIPVRSTLLEGSVAEAIESHVQTSAVDLVVMSTHGRGAMGRFWLGSVADRLMRRLHVPVLVVRPHWDDDTPESAGRRILVALDGSSHAEAILEQAMGFGGSEAEYLLVSVVEPPVPMMDMAPATALPDLAAIEAQLVKAAEAYLSRVVDRLRNKGRRASAHVVTAPRIPEALLEQAKRLDANLIAIATHGAGGLKRFALGSVTDKVVRGSPCPVLVFRPQPGSVKPWPQPVPQNAAEPVTSSGPRPTGAGLG